MNEELFTKYTALYLVMKCLYHKHKVKTLSNDDYDDFARKYNTLMRNRVAEFEPMVGWAPRAGGPSQPIDEMSVEDLIDAVKQLMEM